MSETRWWWVRHARIPGAEGRINGQLDVDCDASDGAAAASLAAILPADAVTIVSPLVRTRQTLSAVTAAGLPCSEPLSEPAFTEQSFGRWQGAGWAELQARDPEAMTAFWQDPTGSSPPGGESFAMQIARVGAAIDRLSAQLEGRDIACFSHGGTIRAACAHALGLPPAVAMAIVVDNLSLTRLDHLGTGLLRGTGGVWRVVCINAPARWISRSAVC